TVRAPIRHPFAGRLFRNEVGAARHRRRGATDQDSRQAFRHEWALVGPSILARRRSCRRYLLDFLAAHPGTGHAEKAAAMPGHLILHRPLTNRYGLPS